MIKHDYKPQSNQKLLKKPLRMDIPEWLTHPYLIIAMAVSTLLLAIVLSLPESDSEVVPVITEFEETLEQDAYVLNEELNVDNETVYGEPIDIQLEIRSSINNNLEEFKIISESQWKSEAVKKGDNLSKIFKRIGLTPQQLHQVRTAPPFTRSNHLHSNPQHQATNSRMASGQFRCISVSGIPAT